MGSFIALETQQKSGTLQSETRGDKAGQRGSVFLEMMAPLDGVTPPPPPPDGGRLAQLRLLLELPSGAAEAERHSESPGPR